MDRRAFLQWTKGAGFVAVLPAINRRSSADSEETDSLPAASVSASPETILLKDYRPQSIYKIPVTLVPKAKYPVIDVHSHPYAKTAQEIDQWVRTMDAVGVEKTLILTMSTGAEFDETQKKYSQYPDRFEPWCGFDFSGYDQPGFGAAAVKELERCHQAGARG